MSKKLKVGGLEQDEIKGSAPLKEIVIGFMSQQTTRIIWAVIGAVLAFLLIQFWDLSSLIHDLNGKLMHYEQNIELLQDERSENFTHILEFQNQLIKDNENLRKELNNIEIP
ncbi:hypothetical protein ACFL2V_12710 [Pseudomonadota bacterium]